LQRHPFAKRSGAKDIAESGKQLQKKPHKITLKTPLIKIDFLIGGTAE